MTTSVRFQNPLANLSDANYKFPVSAKKAEELIKIDNYAMAIIPIATVVGLFVKYKEFSGRHAFAQKHVEQLLANRKIALPSAEMIEKAVSRRATHLGVMAIVAAIAISILCLASFLFAYYDKKNNQEIVQLGGNLSQHMQLTSYWLELSTFQTYFEELEKKLPPGSDDRLKARVFKIFYQQAQVNKELAHRRPEAMFSFLEGPENGIFLSIHARGRSIFFTRNDLRNEEWLIERLNQAFGNTLT